MPRQRTLAWRINQPPPLYATAQSTVVEQQLRHLIDTLLQLVWSALPDGFHDYYNARWYQFTGATPDETSGAGWHDARHADRPAAMGQRGSRAVALTAFVRSQDAFKALECGFDRHLTKPIEPAQLTKELASLISDRLPFAEPGSS